MGAINQFTR